MSVSCFQTTTSVLRLQHLLLSFPHLSPLPSWPHDSDPHPAWTPCHPLIFWFFMGKHKEMSIPLNKLEFDAKENWTAQKSHSLQRSKSLRDKAEQRSLQISPTGVMAACSGTSCCLICSTSFQLPPNHGKVRHPILTPTSFTRKL